MSERLTDSKYARLWRFVKSSVHARANGAFPQLDNLPHLSGLLDGAPDMWRAAVEKAQLGPPVLIATNTGGHGPVAVVESMLAVALTLRGAKVHTLLCDGALPGCLQAQVDSNVKPETLVRYELPAVLCGECIRRGASIFEPLGLSHHRLSEVLTEEERQEGLVISRSVPIGSLKNFKYEGLAVGEHALAGALRYFARGTLDESCPNAAQVVQRYLEAAMLTVFGVRRILKVAGIRHAVFHHGIYVPQGLVGEVCRAQDVHVSNWVVAYRQNTFIFSHDNTYHRTLIEEPVSHWQTIPWNRKLEQQVLSYLRSRWHGGRDWIYFHEKPDADLQRFSSATGFDASRTTIGLLTNVFWDAQLHYRQSVFENMLDWLVKTIEYFRTRPDLQLLVRIHPAEVRGAIKSRQPLTEEIKAAIPDLPANVFVVPPDDNLNTYVAMQGCDSVIIYGTKTGVELTSLAIPVIVAGEAWIRNKGLTIDASCEEDYFRILDSLPVGRRLDEAVVTEARKYAYHFFFRRMIPLPFVQPASGWPNFRLTLDSLSGLSRDRSAGLDLICEAIMDRGKPFVYEAESLGLHDEGPAPRFSVQRLGALLRRSRSQESGRLRKNERNGA